MAARAPRVWFCFGGPFCSWAARQRVTRLVGALACCGVRRAHEKNWAMYDACTPTEAPGSNSC
eukprot:scaffold14365_cov101-Isochrysis_galbana.AAC.3